MSPQDEELHRTEASRSCAACCRRPCFDRRIGLDDPRRSLPTPDILWLWGVRLYTQRPAVAEGPSLGLPEPGPRSLARPGASSGLIPPVATRGQTVSRVPRAPAGCHRCSPPSSGGRVGFDLSSEENDWRASSALATADTGISEGVLCPERQAQVLLTATNRELVQKLNLPAHFINGRSN